MGGCVVREEGRTGIRDDREDWTLYEQLTYNLA